MAWTAVPTFTSGNVLTAAQMQILGGNLNETAPALATTSGQYFVATGANSIAARSTNRKTNLAAESTTSTSYTNLATPDPVVTVTSGDQCLVMLQSKVQHGTALGNAYMSFQVTGASSIAADDEYALAHAPGAASGFLQCSFVVLMVSADGWTAGSNTIQGKYRTNTGTASFDKRRVTAFPY